MEPPGGHQPGHGLPGPGAGLTQPAGLHQVPGVTGFAEHYLLSTLSAFTFVQATYGECDLERENITGSVWFTENPREIQKM